MSLSQKDFYRAECLLWISRKGHHLLFDKNEIILALKKGTDLVSREFQAAEKIFAKLLCKPSVMMKREFLASLSKEDHELFIRAYFHIVEHQLLEEFPTLH